MRKTTLLKCNWRGMTTWMPTHAPNLWVIRPGSSLSYSCAMNADHPWDVTLTGRLFPSGSLMVMRTTAFPTPHAWTIRDLGFPLLVTGVWPENHPFRFIFTVELPMPEAFSPCLEAVPSSAPLNCEPSETLPCFANLLVGPCLRAPPCLWSTPESEDWSVHKPPSLELSICLAKRLWPRHTDLRGFM